MRFKRLLLPRAVVESLCLYTKTVPHILFFYKNVKTFLFHFMLSPRNKATISNSSSAHEMLFSNIHNEYRGGDPGAVQHNFCF